MWTGENHFYDILAMARVVLIPTLCKHSLTFSELLLDTSGLRLLPCSPDLFEQLERVRINAMATYVDLNSPGTPSLSRASSSGKDTENEKVRRIDETNIAKYYSVLSSRISGLTLNAPCSSGKAIDPTNSLTIRDTRWCRLQAERTENSNAGGLRQTIFGKHSECKQG